ncbi:hypothetical protein [Pedobacter sp. UBA4863]|uniref:hypothetical protein n=1 Tax=Pedobacter sp. UBA4863 TaxID=1947060 RepID=UPI0025EDED42|nr:hypothetical protein [Pedobacter sp. UBA4863]
MNEKEDKKAEFIFRNEEKLSSNVLAISIFIAFLIYFISQNWYWMTGVYLLIIGYLLISYYQELRVIEIHIYQDYVDFIFSRKMQSQKVQYNRSDLHAEKDRNASYKFSMVYNLNIFLGSNKLFTLRGASEFATEDIEDLNLLLNKTFTKEII